MKIITVDGRVRAEAESLADVKALLALAQGVAVKRATYKTACSICGKRVKYTEAHIKKMHTLTP